MKIDWELIVFFLMIAGAFVNNYANRSHPVGIILGFAYGWAAADSLVKIMRRSRR